MNIHYINIPVILNIMYFIYLRHSLIQTHLDRFCSFNNNAMNILCFYYKGWNLQIHSQPAKVVWHFVCFIDTLQKKHLLGEVELEQFPSSVTATHWAVLSVWGTVPKNALQPYFWSFSSCKGHFQGTLKKMWWKWLGCH